MAKSKTRTHVDLRGLRSKEKKVNSQQGEDGVLEYIFSLIKPTVKTVLEFGAGDGKYLSNSRNLVDNHGWNAVLLDINPKADNVIKADVNAETINDLCNEHLGKRGAALVSIDIDGNDYWVWKAMKIDPQVVIIECNPSLRGAKTIKYDPNHRFNEDNYFGASYEALCKLGKEKGYVPVYSNTINVIFVKEKYVAECDTINYTHRQGWPASKRTDWVNV